MVGKMPKGDSMAYKARKTEMTGDSGRWITREESKRGSKKLRRRNDKKACEDR